MTLTGVTIVCLIAWLGATFPTFVAPIRMVCAGIIVYLMMAIAAGPCFSILLLFHPIARHALLRGERWSAFATCVAVPIAGLLIGWMVAHMPSYRFWAMLTPVLIAMPVRGIYNSDETLLLVLQTSIFGILAIILIVAVLLASVKLLTLFTACCFFYFFASDPGNMTSCNR